LDVINNHSPEHVVDFAVVDMIESNENLRTVFNELQLNEWLSAFNGRQIQTPRGLFFTDYFVTYNWMTLVAELDITPPNTSNLIKVVCLFCGTTKQYLRHEWYESPFTFLEIVRSIDDYPNAALWAVPLDKRRYDWMHGCARLLSNALIKCFKLFPDNSRKKNKFKQIMESIVKKWTSKTAIAANEMKIFFKRQKEKEITALYESINETQNLL
jgi:hypothetical protein